MSTVDVVIPNYNYARFLPDCVDSVLGQDHSDVRVLIVDNASTDDSVAVARQLVARDRRVHLITHARNLGPHASINEGLDWASSDYLVVLCADDMLAPGALSSAVRIMDLHPDVAMAYGAYRTVSSRPEPVVTASKDDWSIESGEAFIRRFCGKIVLTVAPVVRTRVQKVIGHYRKELFHTDDLEMLLRLATAGDIAVTSSVMAYQRWHGANLSQMTSDDAVRRWEQESGIFKSFFAHEGATLANRQELESLARRSLAGRAYWSALSQMCRGNFSNARSVMKFSIATDPRNALLPPIAELTRIDAPLKRVRSLLRVPSG